MLIFTRKQNEVVRIGDNIRVKLVEIQHGWVRIGIEAPKDIPVHREEVYLKIQKEPHL